MNKLILSGYPYTATTEFEQLLNQFGMQTVLPSRREKLLPCDINNVIKEEYSLNFLDSLKTQSKIEEVEINPLWNSLILDLMLGNLHQEIYGWSDPNLIFLFDYWRALDSVSFIFVFDSPVVAIRKQVQVLLEQGEKVDLPALLNQWKVYHKTLLELYRKHPDMFVIFGLGKQTSALEYFDTLNQKLNNAFNQLQRDSLIGQVVNFDSIDELKAEDSLLQNLIEQTVLEDRVCMQIFQDLNKIASNTLVNSQPRKEKAPFTKVLVEYLEVKSHSLKQLDILNQDIFSLKRINENLIEDQNSTQKLLQVFKKELFKAQETMESNAVTLSQKIAAEKSLGEELAKVKSDLAQAKASLSQLKLQNEKNIHNDQDKIKGYENKIKQLDAEIKKLTNDLKEKDKMILSQKLRADEAVNKNNVLLKKLIQTQELLEKQYHKVVNRPIDNIVKQQLPYQLGALVLENTKDLKGLANLPALILKEKQKHIGEQEPVPQTIKEKKQLDKVKSHLSYRLGKVIVDNTITTKDYYKLPVLMTKEIVKFKFYKK